MRSARHLLPCRSLLCTVATAGAVLVAPLAAGPDRHTTPDNATISHVLNRMTFGPRTGDVERVSKMGLDAYVDEQLHPERIDDSALDARLASFQTLTMSSADLAERYFEPAMAARQAAKQASSATDDNKDDRTPAEPIGQRTLDRRGKKLRERPRRPHQSVEHGRLRRMTEEKFLDQLRQHRNDDAERQHVEQDGHENEENRGFARPGLGRWLAHRRILAACSRAALITNRTHTRLMSFMRETGGWK